MSTLHPPEDAPPTYEAATQSSGAITPTRVSTDGPSSPTTRNGIPPEARRSMEDEHRPLPPGWARQFDPIEQHQFFVDTRANPPRSIWVHPYDDQDFLATLPPSERKKHSRLHRSVTLEDVAAEDTDDDEPQHPGSRTTRPANASASGAGARISASPEPTGIHKFGRKMKDKLTSTTHTQREATRTQRAEQERRAYETHIRARAAMIRALETGEPQFLGKDRQGRDVYIEPPPQRGPFGGYYGGGRSGAYGYSPFAQGGPYGDPSMRFLRPAMPYGRRPGYGYGGGIGMPIAAGLMGGALAGGLLF